MKFPYNAKCALLEISEGGAREGGNRDVSCADQINVLSSLLFSFCTESKLCKNMPSVRLW